MFFEAASAGGGEELQSSGVEARDKSFYARFWHNQIYSLISAETSAAVIYERDKGKNVGVREAERETRVI